MKKRRIRYSELGQAPSKKEPRVSTPVELARSLATPRDNVALRPPAEGPAFNDKQVLRSAQDDSAALGMTSELLLFTVGEERYAVPLVDVEEAIDVPKIHFVPEMPASMLGVISLRERLVPVYSPASALGQPLASRGAVLIFRTATRHVGVVVDDVEDAVVALEDDMKSVPGVDHDELIVGAIHHEGHLISVLRGTSLVAACRGSRTVAPV